MTKSLFRPPCLELYRAWLATGEADELLDAVLGETPWEQKQITVMGKTSPVPRLTCWIGASAYDYSGVHNAAHGWTERLDALRERLEAATEATYNSCLLNRYRSGRDSVAWHSDDEPELGPTPTIASLSLGAARDFQMRPVGGGLSYTTELGHGDLVVMSGESQSAFRHQVPKRSAVAGERVNLTFRLFRA